MDPAPGADALNAGKNPEALAAAEPLPSASADETLAPCSMRSLMLYFLKLGAIGFGGPIALIGYMQRDLVDDRHWLTHQEYMEGLALSEMAPGPLAAQMGMYIGWVRGGTLGATLIGLAFIFPSLLMVLAISALYVHYGSLPWMQGLFYGISAAVIAIIALSARKLMKTILGKDRLLWAIFAINGLLTAVTGSEVVWIFLLSGLAAMWIKTREQGHPSVAAVLGWPALTTGLHGAVSGPLVWKVLVYFATAGAFVFGSGLAVVPFLHGGVVDHYHWLTEKQFVDAVAVAMITPGPVVITVAFIGFLVAGLLGGLAAALGVFLPVYLIIVLLVPVYRRYKESVRLHAFIAGVTAAATGAIAGAVIVLGRRAIYDVPTALIALAALGLLLYFKKKLPEPVLIVLAGIAGLILYPMTH